ncbi:MAG: enoyl-CoA hydratase [Flavobacteriales bacterium]|nr:enoyl-CoA hydratase [Flavobacteriales bacterium]
MSFENILTHSEDRVLIITINREKQLNALNTKTIDELSQALSAADTDPETRVVIITGSGEKAFVAGADIKEFADHSVEEAFMLSEEGQNKLFDKIEKMTTPVIAAINGFALGGGLELALSCHMRLASTNAKLGLPEVSLGLIPGYGGTQRLAQNVGKGKALEMICSAGMISAEDGHSWGLINRVTEPEDLIPQAKKLASKILANSGNAIASAILSVNANYSSENGYEVEKQEFAKCFGHEESKEGISAFLEKRKANF